MLASGDYTGWTSTLSGQWGRRLRLGSEPCRQLGACLKGNHRCHATSSTAGSVGKFGPLRR